MDLAAGIRLAQTTFRIDETLAPGWWRIEAVSKPYSPQAFAHAKGGPNELTAENITRHARGYGEGVELLLQAAPDLRDRLRDIIEGIESEERAERIERGEEKPPAKSLSWSGKVTLSGGLDDHPLIDGEDVLDAVVAEFGRGTPLVEVYLGAEREHAVTVAGPVEADEGFKGSDVTPAEVPRIVVGGFGLLDKLRDLNGRHVELVVREVERPEPFFIEVDPRLPDGHWNVPDARFSGMDRPSAELTGEQLIELVERGADRAVVSFSMHSQVKRAIAEYTALEREQGRVLAPIEVVPGKGRAVGTVNVSIDQSSIKAALNLADMELALQQIRDHAGEAGSKLTEARGADAASEPPELTDEMHDLILGVVGHLRHAPGCPVATGCLCGIDGLLNEWQRLWRIDVVRCRGCGVHAINGDGTEDWAWRELGGVSYPYCHECAVARGA